jgi:hypothetical protein
MRNLRSSLARSLARGPTYPATVCDGKHEQPGKATVVQRDRNGLFSKDSYHTIDNYRQQRAQKQTERPKKSIEDESPSAALLSK